MAGNNRPPAAGIGRTKGNPNKATKNARLAVALLVEGNIERLQGWLDEIAQDQGAQAAWDCMMDIIEYHIPKLQRTELSGVDGKDLTVQIVRYGDDTPTE